MKKGTWIAIISVAALSVLITISLMQMSPNPAISDKMNQSIAKIKVRYAMVNASEEFQEIVEEAAGDDFEQTEIPEKTPEPTPEPIGENVQVTSSNATPEPELTQEQKNMEAAKEGVSLVYMPQPGRRTGNIRPGGNIDGQAAYNTRKYLWRHLRRRCCGNGFMGGAVQLSVTLLSGAHTVSVCER